MATTTKSLVHVISLSFPHMSDYVVFPPATSGQCIPHIELIVSDSELTYSHLPSILHNIYISFNLHRLVEHKYDNKKLILPILPKLDTHDPQYPTSLETGLAFHVILLRSPWEL